MRSAKNATPTFRFQRRVGRQHRQCVVLLTTLSLILAACGGPRPPVGQIGNVSGFLGVVAADEPNAALVARDALSAGGSAVDAAVAAFFMLSVTYPAGAGIGGGGICLVYDATTNIAETLEFLPASPADGGPYAVPGAVRGMATLHARYGRLRWEQLISPAESLARFGHSISRALSKRLAAAEDRVAANPELRAAFMRPDGTLKGEGETLIQVELAAALSQIRSRGVGDYYGGQAGRSFAAAAQSAGGKLTIDDLRNYRPSWRQTRSQEIGNLTLHTALPPPRGGNILFDLVERLRASDDPTRPDRLAAAAAAAYGEIGAELPVGGDAAVVVGDRRGSAVACVFTMHGEFGTGRSAAGVMLAPNAPEQAAYLSPLLAVNPNVDQAFMAAAASGGAAAPVAVARVVLGVLAADEALTAAMAGPRAFNGGAAPVAGTAAAGSDGPADNIGRVQALWCPAGLKRQQERCTAASDPRGFGLALIGE